ncbi:MAG TPA: hypothetical protein VG269_16670 [Tepidisphaeraceae bacterium]|jgi:hypothetical protein|nr:hypothetical protein [Tepidisphaeraceae bacterium]
MAQDKRNGRGWPEDLLGTASRPQERTPEEILQSEAEDLGAKTNGLLKGRVDIGAQGEYIVLDFFIVAPKLENYEYRLLKARHKLLPEYPVEVILSTNDKRRAKNADGLEIILSDIFRAQSTRSIVGQLLDLTNKRGQAASG